MYIHPFIGGVLTTIFTELIILLVISLVKMGGKK